jgi:hypothetical protein
MSIASLGIVGSLAGTAISQRAAEAERTERETSVEKRAAEATEKAEKAAGIGETEEDSQASERDADGRRLWEEPGQAQKKKMSPEPTESAAPLTKDPSGACGSTLDLVG